MHHLYTYIHTYLSIHTRCMRFVYIFNMRSKNGFYILVFLWNTHWPSGLRENNSDQATNQESVLSSDKPVSVPLGVHKVLMVTSKDHQVRLVLWIYHPVETGFPPEIFRWRSPIATVWLKKNACIYIVNSGLFNYSLPTLAGAGFLNH